MAGKRTMLLGTGTMALLIASRSPAAEPARPYPARDVLEGFAEACRPLAVLEDAAEAAERTGWKVMQPDPNSPLGALISFGKSEGEKLLRNDFGEILRMQVFQRTVAGEQLTLVLSGVKLGGRLVHGCRMYDVGETREMPIAEVEKWLKSPRDKGRAASGTPCREVAAGLRPEPQLAGLVFRPSWQSRDRPAEGEWHRAEG